MLRGISRVKPLLAHQGSLTPRTFVEQYQLASRPGLFPSLITTDRTDHRPHRPCWPALASWSHTDQLGKETLAGMRRPDTDNLIVPVEVSRTGRGYNTSNFQQPATWDRIQLPFATFLDAFIAQKIPWQADPTSSSAPSMVGYMAQFDLLSASPSLFEDAPGLPHTKAGPRGDLEQWRSNVWIGPPDTFTPLHRDPYENMFVQVVGRKRIHIIPPTAENSLYLFDTGPQVNTSRVEAEEMLLEEGREEMLARYPLLDKALGAAHAACLEVGPGDVVYIPQGWFHCVRSLETSVSVNWWFR